MDQNINAKLTFSKVKNVLADAFVPESAPAFAPQRAYAQLQYAA